jgi:hypothetical protein
MNRFSLSIALCSLAVAGTLWADDTSPAEEGPGRGVGRISLINGDVSVRRGDSGDVVAAAINAPLMSQDRLLTSSASRAELQFDSANMLRVGSNAEVRLGEVEYQRYQIQVALGTVTFRVLRDSRAQVELDTPSVSLRPLGRGIYRISVREDGSSEITVRAGEAEVAGPRGSERLRVGSTMLARGSADDPEFQIVAAYGGDDWDRWNEHRDHDLESSRSYRYVSPDINGAEDLDNAGRWVQDPTYGNVWAPTVAPGWAPYRAGRWVWEDYYGWTWVSNEPWGWAPYHYGSWFNGPFGWCWYPGPIYSHYYYRPALVAFFGFGGGGGFGFGFGGVGWVPLAPFERFHPWWGRGGFGRTAVFNTTIVRNTNIFNSYRNARVVNGVSGLNTNEFGRRGGAAFPVNQTHLQQAGLVRGTLPVTPDRASLRLSDREVRGNPPQTRNERFFSRSNTTQSARVPFEQQRQAMEQASRRGFNGSVNELRVGNSPASINSGGPRTFGGQTSDPRGVQSSGGHQWSRFGEPIHGQSVQSAQGRQFGQAPQSRADFRGNPQAADNGGRQFGGGARFESRPQPQMDRAPSSSSQRLEGSRGSFGGGNSAPVRISPQIVHDRPSYSGGGGGGRGYSAPQRSSGGGGGGSHSSGGGGGHSNSGGGGGHHGR